MYFVRFAEQFLSARFSNGDLNLSQLCAKDVTDFVRNRAHQLSPGRAKLLVTALRSLLRYVRHQGEIPIDLARCVLPVAMWSLSTLPKFLPAGTVQRLLDQCERETPRERGTTPFSCCSPAWGLRACEIVALELDDIDWDNGQITSIYHRFNAGDDHLPGNAKLDGLASLNGFSRATLRLPKDVLCSHTLVLTISPTLLSKR